MRTVMVDGKDALVFESMKEYLEYFGATVEDYELRPTTYEGERMVRSFRPVNDVNFGTHSADMIALPDLAEDPEYPYFQHVNWGEDEYCLIPEGDVDAMFYLVWEWNPKLSGYDTRGEIFFSREEAEKAAA